MWEEVPFTQHRSQDRLEAEAGRAAGGGGRGVDGGGGGVRGGGSRRGNHTHKGHVSVSSLGSKWPQTTLCSGARK